VITGLLALRYVWTTLLSKETSAGHFGCSAFVVFDKPAPGCPRTRRRAALGGSHGTELIR